MTGEELKVKFDTQWGAFRKFIAANPLTGFWIGVASGGVILGAIIGDQLGPVLQWLQELVPFI